MSIINMSTIHRGIKRTKRAKRVNRPNAYFQAICGRLDIMDKHIDDIEKRVNNKQCNDAFDPLMIILIIAFVGGTAGILSDFYKYRLKSKIIQHGGTIE
jgi:hypothetical protein